MPTSANLAAPDPARRRISRSVLAENVAGFLFISPWIVGFLLFEAGPILAAMYISLTNYDLLTMAGFVGLRNYERMFTRDPLFWHSLRVTAIYSVASVPLHTVLGLALALLLNQRVRGIAVFRTIFYLPAVVSGVAVAYIWLLGAQPRVRHRQHPAGGRRDPGARTGCSPPMGAAGFILMSLWGLGGGMVIFLAGLQGVPTELYEAAAIDGAGRWRRFWHITVPMISPVIFFNLVLGIISSFQVFTAALRHDRRRPGQRDALLRALPLPQRLPVLQDGLRLGAGLGALPDHPGADRSLSFRLSSGWVYYEGRQSMSAAGSSRRWQRAATRASAGDADLAGRRRLRAALTWCWSAAAWR